MMGRWTYSYRRKWRLIAIAVFTLLMIQFLLAYNFYSANHDEEDRIETWQRRVEALEIAQQNHIKSANENVKHENELRTPGGAADGPNVLHSMTPRTGNETLIKRCDLKSKDALSALSRATSHQCQQEIIDTACRNEAQTLYPQHITSTCTLRDKQGGVHLGCFEDKHNQRTLDAPNVEFRDHNSPHRCINYCLRMGYRYAGVEYGYECWCGESVMMSRLLKENRCTTQCAGLLNSDRMQYCGGYLAINVYNTGLGEKIQNAAPLISSKDLLTTERRVRIVFLLSLNGRALRQVTRFIKTIYHKEHYYYIHIDARQEYLHRELSRLLSGYTNIRLTSWRMSTIWGGSSLLTMLRRSMADLLDMAWEWDYFINLSESDYPLKTVDELVAYLTRFNTNNFVKSHGNNNTPRFIRKQGLDRTFYECDTHMWRLGDRSLPDGIRVDGGSDWLCLHRTFITYAMKEGNPLIDGLLQYWNHSLLSAESFFHTVLQNSKFCESIINNNLHLTNWRRKQGCKCQYKHVVDWCGCSPNDFLTEDLDKLMETEKKPLYFARKFEAIINQEVINQLEMVVFDKTQENIPGWQSFWMNLYHFEDQWNSSSDSQHTVYKAFTRIATKHVQNILHSSDCAFTPGRVLEVYSYHHVDTLQGVTIRYEALQQSTNENVELEALIHIQRRYTIVQPLGPANRLLKLQVGNQYDPKEEMFRNVGSILGPYDSVSMIAEWTDGDAFTATFTWVDPAGNVAATYEQTVKEEHYVLYHSASLDTPLRPGLWTLKMSHMWAVAAETQFVITPFSYYGGRAITPDEARAIHKGPSQQKAPSSIEKAPNTLNKEQLQELYDQANRNAEKTGVELLDWIDRLLTEVWRVSDVCLLSAGVNKCNALSPCIHKAWSPATKDPKSVIHGVDPKTGRMVP